MKSEKSHYPMEVEYLFTECVSTLLSEFKFAAGYQAACAAVAKMESDVPESLKKNISGLIFNSGQNCRAAHDSTHVQILEHLSCKAGTTLDRDGALRQTNRIGTTSTTAIYYVSLPVIT